MIAQFVVDLFLVGIQWYGSCAIFGLGVAGAIHLLKEFGGLR